MNLEETAVLLGAVAAYDRRHVGESDVESWQRILADVSYPDALDAITDYFANATDGYLKPGHVVAYVKRLRKARLDACEPGWLLLALTADPDDVPRWIEQRRVLHALVAGGHVSPAMTREAVAVVLHRAAPELAPPAVRAQLTTGGES